MPCFCAGADQVTREIRPQSIRGSLRWWFRTLGGTREQENETFGGADPVTASAVQIRVSNIQEKSVGSMPEVSGIDPLSYILYFPSVAADKRRWNSSACYGSGTTFNLHIRQLRKISSNSNEKLTEAIIAFRHYGSIGMHITRGLGAIQDIEITAKSWNSTDQIMKDRGFTIRASNRSYNLWDEVLTEAGKWLQRDLRKEFGAGGNGAGGNKKPAQFTALGSASPRQTSAVYLRPVKKDGKPHRQTSAVYLRPVKKDGKLFFSAFEAPHDKVLGEKIPKRKHSEPVLKSRDFTQNRRRR